MVVQHVNIQGLGRTKEDLLGYEISDVFLAKNLIDVSTAVVVMLCNANAALSIYSEIKGYSWSTLNAHTHKSVHQLVLFPASTQVMKRAHVARQKLLRLGIFKDVEVLIDTSEGKLYDIVILVIKTIILIFIETVITC